MTKMSDLRSKKEAELQEVVTSNREILRTERFKDKYSRKASIIGGAKKDIARALTELHVRAKQTTK